MVVILMVIYHGTLRQKSAKKKLQEDGETPSISPIFKG